MKYIKLVLAASLFALGLSSCLVVSLHPLATQDNRTFDPALLGRWQDRHNPKAHLQFSTKGDSTYSLLITEETSQFQIIDTIRVEVSLVKLGENYFLDFYPPSEDHAQNLWNNYLPVHTFNKVEFEDEGFTIMEFDQERLQTLFRQNRIRLPHEEIDDVTVITASSKELQGFLSKYADSKEAFNEPSVWKRAAY